LLSELYTLPQAKVPRNLIASTNIIPQTNCNPQLYNQHFMNLQFAKANTFVLYSYCTEVGYRTSGERLRNIELIR